MIRRMAENNLVAWLKKGDRKPLLLRGARQVGKTTLVREFAGNHNLDLLEINLERHLYLDDIFKTTNIPKICMEIEALLGKSFSGENKLLFLDEIQATPNAIMALRYFLEDKPELPVVAAGSLLDFTLADHSFSMPVARIEYLHLYPLTFFEFLSALSLNDAKILTTIATDNPPTETIHRKLLDRLREYFFVGGMPEAVKTFQVSGSLKEVVPVHRAIINTYIDDFAKYARRQDLILLQKVFNYIPRNLGNKVKYSNIDRDNRAAKVKDAIQLLTKARVCNQVFHSNCNKPPLHADIDENKYKLLFLDIGLANYVCGLDWTAISAMDERNLVNEGGLAEQFIGQHLVDFNLGLEPPRLHYWIREKKTANAEVDYVLSEETLIFPVEVKAGKSGSLKSIHHFIHNKKRRLAIRFDLNPPSVQQVHVLVPTGEKSEEVSFVLYSLPLYAVSNLQRIVELLRKSFCPKCGQTRAIKSGKNGKFLGCRNFPECRQTDDYDAFFDFLEP